MDKSVNRETSSPAPSPAGPKADARPGVSTPAPRRLRALARGLVDWYDGSARDLPWRRTRDPYGIWVSEVMLQQTRVEVVSGRWAEFLRRFPDLASLAAAEESDVLATWAGLGYYRRARQLHAAARRVVEVHGDTLPSDAATLRLLPGFGSYTAGAVASIAFDEKVPAVDGNVERVIARLLALDVEPKRAAGATVVREVATGLLRDESPGTLNQALMELGATVCTPRSPNCRVCPWRGGCRAHASGTPERWPLRAARKKSVEVASYAAVVRDGDSLLWRRRPEGVPNAGLWELPTTEWHPGTADVHAAHDALEDLGRQLDRRWRVGEALASARHGITHHRITVVAHAVVDTGDPVTGEAGRDLRRAPVESALDWGLTAATRKILDRLPTLI